MAHHDDTPRYPLAEQIATSIHFHHHPGLLYPCPDLKELYGLTRWVLDREVAQRVLNQAAQQRGDRYSLRISISDEIHPDMQAALDILEQRVERMNERP